MFLVRGISRIASKAVPTFENGILRSIKNGAVFQRSFSTESLPSNVSSKMDKLNSYLEPLLFSAAEKVEKINSYMGPLVLISAAAKGDLHTIKHLIEQEGVNPNEGDYDGRTALHLASEEGHLDIVKYLISKGVNLNAHDRWGSTPLRGAISYNRREICNLLKDSGATFKVAPSKMVLPHSAQNVAKEERNEKLLEVFHGIAEIEQGTLEKDRKPGPVSVKHVYRYLHDLYGLTPRKNSVLSSQLNSITNSNDQITMDAFLELMNGPENLLQRAFDNRLVVSNWASFCQEVTDIFESVRRDVPSNKGKNATYIPELANVDPDLFGLSIMTVDGQMFHLGDWDTHFSIQSCSKPVTYSLCSEAVGPEMIHKYVGQEPSGVAFNAFTLNKNKKPHNPLINSGAIMVAGLYKPELSLSQRFRKLTEGFSEMAGGFKIGFNQSVYLSEKSCAHRNFALAHFMAAEDAFPESANILEAVDFYFQACSCEVDTNTLASMAATYANNGRHPFSSHRTLSFSTVKNTLQLMNSCGMYDFSGEWACTVGLAAKSGVSGNIFSVVPDILGLAIYSPPLDPQGNSTRGVEFLKRFSKRFNWGLLDLLFSKQYDNRKQN
eukprot:TRINITY_DN3274_c0_g3_i1.p1 TRINITY_DN3274_c0_g3~~TRINITY_DN3274_c0_g3_i1.p1  ORF type:complete len:607 (+),score=113.71 TRINITY_DN3274_c0_g3_i1:134-1954(+)